MDVRDTESRLELVLAAGAAAWPAVRLDRDALACHLDACARAPLCEQHAADVYLACASALGDLAATRAIDRVVRTEIARVIARIDSSSSFVDDTLQALRMKLLVGPTPKIGTYGGQASLRTWLGVAAVRTAISMRRGRENERHEELDVAMHDAVSDGPELAFVRARYRKAFECALRASLDDLTEREKVLLRMNVVERLGVDRLARVYGRGRSTVARWLVAARQRVEEGMLARLGVELGATPSEIANLAAELRSDLDVSIARLLDQPP